MEHNPVIWFEIPVKDLARAKRFYESVLGYQFEEQKSGASKMAFFPMKEEASGACGALSMGAGYRPSADGVLIYFSVENIEKTLSWADKNGGKTELAKNSIGEYGFIGIFVDTEGNRIGVHSMK